MKVKAIFWGEYPKGTSPMSQRLHYYMKALKSKGVEVEIIAITTQKKSGGIFEGIPFSYVMLPKITRFNIIRIARSIARIHSDIAKQCDVVLSICHINNLITRRIIKHIHDVGGKVVFEVNEIPYPSRSNRLDTNWTLKLKRRGFLKNIVPKTDGIIVISHSLYDLISEYKSKNSVLIRIPILTGETEIRLANDITDCKTPYILFAGALSEKKDGVKAMFKAFAIAHKKLNGNLKFILTAKPIHSLSGWIKNFVKMNALENCIEFKGLIPRDELNELYAKCSLSIVNKPSNDQNDFNFPTKLTELIPKGIPVILSKTGELNKYFKDGETAFMVDGNNVDQIAQKILYILSNPVETKKVTNNARILAEKDFFYLNYADDLTSFFKQISIGSNEKKTIQ